MASVGPEVFQVIGVRILVQLWAWFSTLPVGSVIMVAMSPQRNVEMPLKVRGSLPVVLGVAALLVRIPMPVAGGSRVALWALWLIMGPLRVNGITGRRHILCVYVRLPRGVCHRLYLVAIVIL